MCPFLYWDARLGSPGCATAGVRGHGTDTENQRQEVLESDGAKFWGRQEISVQTRLGPCCPTTFPHRACQKLCSLLEQMHNTAYT